MQQVDEIIQRALMEAHLRVECTHALKNFNAAGIQSPRIRAGRRENNRQAFSASSLDKIIQNPLILMPDFISDTLVMELQCLLFVFM